jgi:hypothetical protein
MGVTCGMSPVAMTAGERGKSVKQPQELPSRRITFGDADRQDPLDAVPGHWRVQVNLEPEDFPGHTETWISSAS